MEIEVKYLIDDCDYFEEKLVDTFPEVKYYKEINLPALYFDTADGMLGKSGAIIRIRQENGKWIGCFKAKTTHNRQFMEEEVQLKSKELTVEELSQEEKKGEKLLQEEVKEELPAESVVEIEPMKKEQINQEQINQEQINQEQIKDGLTVNKLTERWPKVLNWIMELEHYEDIKNIIGNKRIFPIAIIETVRKIFILEINNLTLEIALDKVKYQNGLAYENRLEIELKQGNVQGFEDFLTFFSAHFRELKETNISKYQQAIKLLNMNA